MKANDGATSPDKPKLGTKGNVECHNSLFDSRPTKRLGEKGTDG